MIEENIFQLYRDEAKLYLNNESKQCLNGPSIPIFPYLSKKFLDKSRFRVMQIGINAYLSPKDFPTADKPNIEEVSAWWKDWANLDEQKIHQHMKKTISSFSDLEPEEYRTNLIKIWLPETLGKKDSSLPRQIIDRAYISQSNEFDFLIAKNLFPNLIICHGDTAWHGVWRYFYNKYPDQYTDIERHGALKVYKAGEIDTFVIKGTHHAAQNESGEKFVYDRIFKYYLEKSGSDHPHLGR